MTLNYLVASFAIGLSASAVASPDLPRHPFPIRKLTMTTLRMTFAAFGLSACSSLALAAGNPLSVHVLNLENGLPSPGINVTLEKHVGQNWQPLAQGTTNEQGRIAELFPAKQPFEAGEYRVVFKTGEYFEKNKRETFFPEIPVIFEVKQTDQHYHIPLLLSPYGFSTYRGS